MMLLFTYAIMFVSIMSVLHTTSFILSIAKYAPEFYGGAMAYFILCGMIYSYQTAYLRDNYNERAFEMVGNQHIAVVLFNFITCFVLNHVKIVVKGLNKNT